MFPFDRLMIDVYPAGMLEIYVYILNIRKGGGRAAPTSLVKIIYFCL